MDILIIEDNPGDARLVRLHLEQARAEGRLPAGWTREAVTWKEARRRLEEHASPTVVLLDLSLPDSFGRQTLERALSVTDAPIVVLTGQDDERLAEELIAAGAQDYLLKDEIDARRLARALRHAIERKRAEERALLSAQILDAALEGIAVADADGRIVSVNRAFSAITGWGEAEVVGMPLLADAEHVGFFRCERCDVQEERLQGEARCRKRDGSEAPLWLGLSSLADASGRVRHRIAVFSDISQLKRKEEELRHLAQHDLLTGLPNRLLFQDRLQQARALAQRHGYGLALLVLDLDRFKRINDSLGHAVGDQVLKETARRLTRAVRATDTVARLGGDEFALILTELEKPADAVRVVDKLRTALAAPFLLDGREMFIGASIGIAWLPTEAEEVVSGAFLEQADMAMYHAKKSGLPYAFYAPQMQQESRQRLALELDLRRALEEGQFALHYQPQVEPESRRVIGAEALLRWQHPTRGLVPPAEFIPLLEETGLIAPVGEWVLREACRQALAWDAQGLPPLRIAVNLSVRQLRQPDLVDRIAAILAETGLPPQRLELELTETMVVENTDIAGAVLENLKKLGCRIALDDFGTGASSLGYLMHLPVDTLKIAGAIVYQIRDRVDAAIAEAVIGLARGMSLASVAEGVETEEQLAILRASRCTVVQGYLLGRPMPAEEFADGLRDGRG